MKLGNFIFGLISAVFSIILILFGILFLWSAFSVSATSAGKTEGRLFVGFITVCAGIGLTVLSYILFRRGQKESIIIQKIELPGESELKEIKCRSCGGKIEKNNIEVKNGAIIITCPFCSTTYQLEENPKW